MLATAVQVKIHDVREDNLDDLIAMMKSLKNYFEAVEKAQQKQKTQDSESCCFKFLACFTTKAVMQTQPDPFTPFIRELQAKRLTNSLERPFPRPNGKGFSKGFTGPVSNSVGLPRGTWRAAGMSSLEEEDEGFTC